MIVVAARITNDAALPKSMKREINIAVRSGFRNQFVKIRDHGAGERISRAAWEQAAPSR